jgi:hypothetical protein
MPQEIFEVGDRVLMTPSQHLGTIARVYIQISPHTPNAPGVRRYAIKLDDGGTISGVFRGIERAPERHAGDRSP